MSCNYSSIFDKNVQELVSMDIDEVRNIFLDEINSLKDLDLIERRQKAQHIFDGLFRLLNFNSYQDRSYFDEYENRLFFDLISTPNLFKNIYFQEGLLLFDSIISSFDNYKKFLINIIDFYNNSSSAIIDKFNYLLRSGVLINDSLVRRNNFNFFFNKRVMRLFDKETLCQLYREYSSSSTDLDVILDNNNHKAIYMVSVMAKKLKKQIGHNNELLQPFILRFCPNMKNLLDSMYDKLVGTHYNEKNFEKLYLNSNDYFVVDEFINLITSDYSKSDFYNDYYNYDSFRDSILEKIKNYHKFIFNDIDTLDDLDNFKEALLHNIYGISLKEALDIVKCYGTYMNELERDLLAKDYSIYSVLNSIKRIVRLKLDDEEKRDFLKSVYLEKIMNDSLKEKISCGYMLRGLFNRMVINTYNQKLLKLDSDLEVLGVDDGVVLLDAGVDFTIMLTSLNGTNDFYDYSHNMASKWNTAAFSGVHGLCCSHIRNDNLGVINLNSVLLGFSNIPEYSLNNMGSSDLFSFSNYYNLRDKNNVQSSCSNNFFPVSVMASENRYGYDEFLLDRFLMDDKDGVLKLQPDYVVFYKFNDDYEYTSMYKDCLKVAKDFNIPIVVIDVEKVKENEKKIIKEDEDLLFSSCFCDIELMKKIVTRYMNNYTGSFSMTYDKNINYDEDFSVLGMEMFFDRVIEIIQSISDKDIRDKWICGLEEVYFDEERKYKNAKNVQTYNTSLQNFIFKKYNLRKKIDCLKQGKSLDNLENNYKLSTINFGCGEGVPRFINLCGLSNLENYSYEDTIFRIDGNGEKYDVFLSDADFSEELKTITDLYDNFVYYSSCDNELCNKKFGSNIIVERGNTFKNVDGVSITFYEASMNEVLIENLIVSYFFEDCSRMIVDDMFGHDFDIDISFKCSRDFDFCDEVNNSFVYNHLFDEDNPSYIPLDREKLDYALKIVEAIPDKSFINVFMPVVEKYAFNNGLYREDVLDCLLEKKKNIRNEFNKFVNKENSFDVKKVIKKEEE